VKLNVNDGNAEKIWGVLTSPAAGDVDADETRSDVKTDVTNVSIDGQNEVSGGSADVGVSERVFVGQLSLWAPPTALQALEGQICERFGNLAEGKRAMERRLSRTNPLSPREFDMRLRAVGIRNPDVEKALGTVASKQGKHQGAVTLDAAINTMRATRRSGIKSAEPQDVARTAVKHDTMQLWEQLRTVQSDLRLRHNEGKQHGSRGAPLDFPSQAASPVTDKHQFNGAVEGAKRSAETSRSKFVLLCAQRQVLQLEERWATNPNASPKKSPHPSGPLLVGRASPKMAGRASPKKCGSKASGSVPKRHSSNWGLSLQTSASEPCLLQSPLLRQRGLATQGSLPSGSPPPGAGAQRRRASQRRLRPAKCSS